jgi:hypothetical protein
MKDRMNCHKGGQLQANCSDHSHRTILKARANELLNGIRANILRHKLGCTRSPELDIAGGQKNLLTHRPHHLSAGLVIVPLLTLLGTAE